MAKKATKRPANKRKPAVPKPPANAVAFAKEVLDRKGQRCKICDATPEERAGLELLMTMRLKGESIGIRDIQEFAVERLGWKSLSNTVIIRHDKHLTQGGEDAA